MLLWKAKLWYSDNLLVETTVTARDIRDATDAAFLSWRALEAEDRTGRLARAGIGRLELADRITVSLLRV
jgi:hypothetical protein